MALGYRWDGTDVIVCVRLQPRASRNEWLGLQEDRFRVRITAPPIEGQANLCLQAFLADLFGVAKSQISLLAGDTGRDKRLRIIAPRCLPLGIAAQPAANSSKPSKPYH